MPRVPTYDNFQVDPIALPAPRLGFTGVQTTASDQAQAMGRQMQGAGEKLNQVALQMQEQINMTRADDASNKLKEAALRLTYDDKDGYTALKGNNALDRPDGKSLDLEYGEKLKKYTDDIAAGLGNDAQREAFMRNAGAIATNFQGGLLKHMADESKSYQDSVDEGVINTSVRELALSSGNPAVVDSATQRIEGHLWKLAQRNGRSAEWVDNKRIELISNAHKGQLSAMLKDGQLDAAQAYLMRNSPNMSADDVLALGGQIKDAHNIQLGQQIGTAAAAQVYSAANPSQLDRLLQVKWQIESGNRQFNKDGSVVRSPVGAVGAAQVMPSTGPEAAALAGLPWDKTRFEQDEAYNKALGKAYFSQKLKEQNGDILKAYAAYNAGSGGVQKGEAAARAWNAKNPSNPRDWLSFMPAETQGYVNKAQRLLATQSAAPQQPSKLDAVNTARQDPRLAGNPKATQAAVEAAEKNYQLAEDDRKTRADNAMAQALQWGAQNSYRMTELPPDLRSQIPPDKWTEIQGQFEKLAKGDNQTNTLAYAKYFNSDAGRKELKGMSQQQAYIVSQTQFSDADGKLFLDLWGETNGVQKPNANAANQAGDLDRSAFKATLEPMLQQLGFSLDKKDKTSMEQVATISYALEKQILRMQLSRGKRFNDAEMAGALDKLLTTTTTLNAGWFGKPEQTQVINIVRNTGQGYNMHPSLKQELKKGLIAQGIADPTDAQINAAYLQRKLGHVN